MLSIFFNFGVDGNTAGAKTYYADSVYMVGGGTVTPIDTHMVTFQVDMNQYGGSFTTPEVNGDFNGWCGGCNALTDNNGDGIWETTLPLTADSIEYKFAYDSSTGQEDLVNAGSCTKTTGAFTNRFLILTGDTTLPAVCWESCAECTTPPDTHMITFQVDMNQYSGAFTTPEVNGDFNGWCGNCNAMSDGDGDNIWDVTIPLWQDSIEYKFAHDTWTGQEELTPGSSCTKTTGAFTNRFIYINGDTILPEVCWASCDACPGDSTTGINTISAANLKLYPNPVAENLRIESEEGIQEIALFNTTGEMVLMSNGLGTNTMSVNTTNLSNGIYFLKAKTQEGVVTKRLIVAK